VTAGFASASSWPMLQRRSLSAHRSWIGALALAVHTVQSKHFARCGYMISIETVSIKAWSGLSAALFIHGFLLALRRLGTACGMPNVDKSDRFLSKAQGCMCFASASSWPMLQRRSLSAHRSWIGTLVFAAHTVQSKHFVRCG
jgi:hypothetical protein